MNKFFLLGVAAVAMLAGCTNDETVEMAPQNAISFTSFVDKSTKATVDVTTANLSSFWVYGWKGNEQIFNAQEVKKVSGAWTYLPIQYWTENGNYVFEAIAPASGSKGVTFSAAKTGGTISFTNDAATDLVYALPVSKTTGASITSDPGKVNFTFKHMLSRVKFTFKNTFPANAAAKITVTDVKITNAHTKGAITPAATTPAWDTSSGTATLSVSFPGTIENLPANTGEGSTDHKYLIPVSNPSYTVSFKVTLTQGSVSNTYPHTATISTTMQPGLSYNFVASLNEQNTAEDELFPIEFTATVTEWGIFGDTNLTVE